MKVLVVTQNHDKIEEAKISLENNFDNVKI